MPRWVAYCPECNHVAEFRKISLTAVDLAVPKVKKPVLPAAGEAWDCPTCKCETHVRDCDLTYSHAT